MKPILYSRIGLLDKLLGVSSPILLAFADCNRANIANKISKTKTKTKTSPMLSFQKVFGKVCCTNGALPKS